MRSKSCGITAFENKTAPARARVAGYDSKLKQMSFTGRQLEEFLRDALQHCPLTKKVESSFGSGILVVTGESERVFKVELTQVAGPE